MAQEQESSNDITASIQAMLLGVAPHEAREQERNHTLHLTYAELLVVQAALNNYLENQKPDEFEIPSAELIDADDLHKVRVELSFRGKTTEIRLGTADQRYGRYQSVVLKLFERFIEEYELEKRKRSEGERSGISSDELFEIVKEANIANKAFSNIMKTLLREKLELVGLKLRRTKNRKTKNYHYYLVSI